MLICYLLFFAYVVDLLGANSVIAASPKRPAE